MKQLKKIPAWKYAANIGYFKTTPIWDHFCIAEKKGIFEIISVFGKEFRRWKYSPSVITEFALVLKSKVAEHYSMEEDHRHQGNRLASVYSRLFGIVDLFAAKTFPKEQKRIYDKWIF